MQYDKLGEKKAYVLKMKKNFSLFSDDITIYIENPKGRCINVIKITYIFS